MVHLKLIIKSKDIFSLVDYFFVVEKLLCLLSTKSHTDGKPVYFPFERCHICKENAFVGGAAELSMWVAPIKNLLNLCRYQTAYSSIDSRLVSFSWLDDWILKNQDILAIEKRIYLTNRGRTIQSHNSLAPRPPAGHQLGHTLLWEGIPFFNLHLT